MNLGHFTVQKTKKCSKTLGLHKREARELETVPFPLAKSKTTRAYKEKSKPIILHLIS